MHLSHLRDMVRGWFIGDFTPTVLRSNAVEVAVQHRAAGCIEPAHVHRVATEITVLVSGRARMAGLDLEPGHILTLPPGTPASFEAITDTICVVVKTPSSPGDKYEI